MIAQSDISKHLQELLFHYDCVIVPELGGFVTEYRSARIDKETHIIYPPSKDLRFNGQLKKNDGLLANAISQATSLSHEESNALLKKTVEDYFTTLEGGRAVTFDKVGVLYLDSQRNIQFKADEGTNYLLDSFHLKKLFARPVSIAEPTPVLEKASEEVEDSVTPGVIAAAKEPSARPEINEVDKEIRTEEDTPIVVMPERSGAWRWMAAALVPLLLYVGWVAVRSDVIHDGSVQMSDLNPFRKSGPEARYENRVGESTFEVEMEMLPSNKYPIAEVEAKYVAADSEELVEELTPDIAETLTAEPVNTYVAAAEIGALEFHVIGGCFSEQSNAERMVTGMRKKGYDAHIIDQHKGLHRVSYGSFVSREEALRLLGRVKDDEQEAAWLLRKK